MRSSISASRAILNERSSVVIWLLNERSSGVSHTPTVKYYYGLQILFLLEEPEQHAKLSGPDFAPQSVPKYRQFQFMFASLSTLRLLLNSELLVYYSLFMKKEIQQIKNICKQCNTKIHCKKTTKSVSRQLVLKWHSILNYRMSI